MKLYQKFLTFSRGKQIALLVFAFHSFVLLSLLIHHGFTRQIKPSKMIVRTVVPPKAIPKPIPVSAPSKKEIASSIPTPKKKEAAKTVKPAVAAKPSITVTAPPVQKAPPSRPSLLIPSKIVGAKEVVEPTPLVSEGPTYGEFLVSHLQSTLDLPEYGEVRAKLEIDRFGKLVRFEVLETKSRINAEFLKKRLPDLTFPCLNDFGIVDATHVFTITFRNEKRP